MIAARTKAGLAAAKAKGVKLGTNNFRPEMVKEASEKGVEVIRLNADECLCFGLSISIISRTQ